MMRFARAWPTTASAAVTVVSLTPLLPALRGTARFGSQRHKVYTADDAAHLLFNGATVTVSGFVTQGCPEEVCKAISKRFLDTGNPKDMTLFFEAGPGDWATKGLNHFGHPGMLKRAIGSHFGQIPQVGKLVQENAIEAYTLPLGSIARMIRATATKCPGHLTKIGTGTLADPKFGGGAANSRTKGDIVSEMIINGERYLFYRALPIDVAIIRGSTADSDGNVTLERESLLNDQLLIAMATRASGGVVVVQVDRLAELRSLDPNKVRIPGTLVDAVVVATNAEDHAMSFITQYNPVWSGDIRAPRKLLDRMEFDERKIVARRAVMELVPNDIVNLGIGMPEGVALVAAEEGILGSVTLTTEPGVHGGIGATGHNFGPADNFDARIEMNQQFDFYNGGGLDTCFLGMAEVTGEGHVNVTRVGKKLTGPGGFIDISQSTKRVNLLGTFTAGGLEVATEGSKLKIVKEGKIKKFVKTVPEITFNGGFARRQEQSVRYITERCVFSLRLDVPDEPGRVALELTEIAPGIDLKSQVLDLMDFTPIIAPGGPRLMDPRLFDEGLMQIKKTLFGVDFEKRCIYDAKENRMYVDVSNVSITTLESLDALLIGLRQAYAKVGKKFHASVCLDRFDVRSDLVAAHKAGIAALETEFYLSVRRHASKCFLRHQLASMNGFDQTRRFVSLPDLLRKAQDRGLAVSRAQLIEIIQEKSRSLSGTELGVEEEVAEMILTNLRDSAAAAGLSNATR